MPIVITGHKGQLGRVLQEVLGSRSGCEIVGLDLPEVDVTDPVATSQAIEAAKPELVIHAAALTDVDGCQRNPDLAYRINALGTHNVALACRRAHAVMVHVSTNEVFDGRRGQPYYEWDQPSPLSVYAQSKAAAERCVLALLHRFFIVRTAWLYAHGGSNFVTKILAAADRQGALRVVSDEVSSPTYAPDLAEAIARLVTTAQYGIYHLTNSGLCSRYEWVSRILQLSGRGHVPLEPITHHEWPRPAPPPLYCPIVNSAGAALGITLRPWEEALADYFRQPPGAAPSQS